MSVKILNLRPPLTHLDFINLFNTEKLTEQGGKIMYAIAFITQPTLSYLNLSNNEELWKDNAIFGFLLDIL